MQLLDLTLDMPAENLALDEALLEAAERSGRPSEVLRLWESPKVMVVVGSSTHVAEEVHIDACRRQGVPVLRRPSGGAPIVAGPGCLMYAVVLSYQLRPQLRMIDRAHRFVLETIAESLNQLGVTAGLSSSEKIHHAGISDLAIGQRKFSGNSMRCKRTHFLYHGTLLYNFPLERMSALLKMPSRQPEYRQKRGHGEFLMNLPMDVQRLRSALIAAFRAGEICHDWPRDPVAQLAAEKYNRADWNERF